jgi:hypothetical protein
VNKEIARHYSTGSVGVGGFNHTHKYTQGVVSSGFEDDGNNSEIELLVQGRFNHGDEQKAGDPTLPLSLYIGMEKPITEKFFDDAKACCNPQTFSVSLR